MSSVNGRKVLRAQISEAIFVPGVGQTSLELSSNVIGDVKALRVDEPFLLVTLITKATKKEVEVAIPLTNVKGLVLAPEETKTEVVENTTGKTGKAKLFG